MFHFRHACKYGHVDFVKFSYLAGFDVLRAARTDPKILNDYSRDWFEDFAFFLGIFIFINLPCSSLT